MKEKIKYLIIEDEEKSRETLLKKIQLCKVPDIVCVGLAANANEAMHLCKMNHPDFLLLDINLPGKNGFELLTDLGNAGIQPAVIFTSAHTENHILLNALKHAPVNYLVKPIDIDELEEALLKVSSQLNTMVYNSDNLGTKIRLQDCYGPLYIEPDQIMLFKADQHYALLTLNNGESILLVQSIAVVLRNGNLNFPPFYKADRSTILNLAYVEHIHHKKRECVLRCNNIKTSTTIADMRINELILALDSYNKVKE